MKKISFLIAFLMCSSAWGKGKADLYRWVKFPDAFGAGQIMVKIAEFTNLVYPMESCWSVARFLTKENVRSPSTIRHYCKYREK